MCSANGSLSQHGKQNRNLHRGRDRQCPKVFIISMGSPSDPEASPPFIFDTALQSSSTVKRGTDFIILLFREALIDVIQ